MCDTTVESSSAVDSIMEDTSQTAMKPKDDYSLLSGGEKTAGEDDCGGDDVEEDECDGEVWKTLSSSFHDVQSLLDQNRTLIQQVNDNHQSRIPDNLVTNVALIREINGNISKVISLYSDLSVNLSNIVRERRPIIASKNGKLDDPDVKAVKSTD